MTKEFLQYGGDHYKKAGRLQHWDMLADCGGYGWEYYIGRATAYLTRVKDTALDPKKAGHFVDKLLELIDQQRVPPVNTTIDHLEGDEFIKYMLRYFDANSITPSSLEASAIVALMQARNRQGLEHAREAVARFEQGRPINPTPAQREVILDREADRPTPEETLNPTGDWPFAQAATPYETPTQIVSGGGGDFGGGGATRSYGDDRVFMVGDTSNDPMPETCSRSDYSSSSDSGSSSSDSGSGGGSSD